MTALITWTDGAYSNHTGRVGGIPLFSINWGTTRDDARPWKLRTHLPITFKYGGGATMDDAKAAAEKVLAGFVSRIGATFTDPEETP